MAQQQNPNPQPQKPQQQPQQEKMRNPDMERGGGMSRAPQSENPKGGR